MISDGRGALEFLKALLGAYVAERYGLPEAAACAYAGTEAQKTEDSFTTNYDRSAAGKAKKPRVFHLTGLKTDADPALPGIPPIGQRRACRRQRRRSQRHLLPHRGGHLRRARHDDRPRPRAGPSTWTSPSTCAASSARPPCATSSGSPSSPTLPAIPPMPRWPRWPSKCSAS